MNKEHQESGEQSSFPGESWEMRLKNQSRRERERERSFTVYIYRCGM